MKRLLAALMVAALVLVAAKPVPTGSIAVSPDSVLASGGFVTFDVDVVPVKKGYVYTSLVCVVDGVVVYQQSKRIDLDPAQTYTDLVAGHCMADLLHRVVKKRAVYDFTVLDSLAFHVEA